MRLQDSGPSWLVISILTINQILATVSLAGDVPKPNPAVGPGTLGSEVNPFIGTGGVTYLCGNTFPGATVPFGMMRLSPDTATLLGRRASNSSGYYYPDSRILGFSHTRLAGTGATEGGNFLVIPCTAETAKSHRRGLNAAYSHQQERAFPGYYGVALPSLGITAELTATRRVGVHRYTFPEHHVPHILIHVTSALGKGNCKSGEVRHLAGREGNRRGRADVRHVFKTLWRAEGLFCRPIQSADSSFCDADGGNGNARTGGCHR